MTPSSRPADFFQAGGAIRIIVGTAAAYLVGSWIGLQLRLPPATPSVIWPPNATVTAILLFVPVRRWWAVLLGAAIAHFAIQLPMWSPALVAGLFLTNCSEAVIAAFAVRYFADQPGRLDTLRRVSIFIVFGALWGPFVSSFLDAAVVTVFHNEDYWTVWKMRTFSNVLAQLAIVPAIAGLLNSGRVVLRWPAHTWLEAAAVAGGLVGVAAAVRFDVGNLGLTNAPLSPFLPLLLWAAVRFGSAGVGLSLLGTVLLAVVAALYGQGLFPMIPPEARIRTLQIFLISAAVPLLCVGALVEERRRTAKDLQLSDSLKSTILTSIPSLVAVIDRNGRIVTVNESWQTAWSGPIAEFSGEGGASYLDLWTAAMAGGPGPAREGAHGIRSVLDGSAPGFSLEYSSNGRSETQWWLMSVVPLKRREGGAVITHTDISARKRAEMAAQQSRDELSHAGRVWVMGELTASLSHQLGQPLTGITTNAQAGRRFLGSNPPNVAEVQEILEDIEADAQRAYEVTHAIREMLAREVATDELLDINDIVRDTLTLLASEATRKGVTQHLQLAPSLRLVRGKRVQLQQLVLNLTMNAIEAMDGSGTGAAAPRVLTVRSEPVGTTHVQVSLLDTGCGLPPGAEEQIFEPLFTTKTSGMGMGLPIARTIVHAHGGTISADPRDAGGAVFRFTLPVSVEQTHGDLT